MVLAGKIQIREDGRLTNQRVTNELAKREQVATKRRAAGHQGGANSGVSRAKSLQDNDAYEAIASTLRSREEERREDTPIVPKGRIRRASPSSEKLTRSATPPSRRRRPEALAGSRKRGASPGEIVAGAKAYAAEQARIGKVGTEFIQCADVWLNRQRCRTTPRCHHPAAQSPQGRMRILTGLSDDRLARRDTDLACARCGHWPLRNRTPPPDNSATKVPPRILAEFGIRHGAGASIAQMGEAS